MSMRCTLPHNFKHIYPHCHKGERELERTKKFLKGVFILFANFARNASSVRTKFSRICGRDTKNALFVNVKGSVINSKSRQCGLVLAVAYSIYFFVP